MKENRKGPAYLVGLLASIIDKALCKLSDALPDPFLHYCYLWGTVCHILGDLQSGKL